LDENRHLILKNALQYLRERSDRISKALWHFRPYYFSPVIGPTEVEISEFLQVFNGTRKEIQQAISRIENRDLRERITVAFRGVESIDLNTLSEIHKAKRPIFLRPRGSIRLTWQLDRQTREIREATTLILNLLEQGS